MTTTKKTAKKTAPKSRKSSKKYVIVRGSLATFCGWLVSAKGQEVTISAARMIGYWEKRHMLSTLAAQGPADGHARLSDATDTATILDATAILVCSDKASAALREIKTYEVK